MVKAHMFILFILSTLCYSQIRDQHTIATFNLTLRDLPQKRNCYITSPASQPLVELQAPPSFIKPGEVVMRKKIDGEYRLYQGTLDTAGFNCFPPLYAFAIPSWSKSGELFWYRFYNSRSKEFNLDEETVYFDSERIYLPRRKEIHYFRKNRWHTIRGENRPPLGDLYVESQPDGAEIYLFGENTGKKTPATLRGLVAGDYQIELFLPQHKFQRRNITVHQDSFTQVSFELFSDFDTLHIMGEDQHGTLVLPYPPQGTPYKLNDSTISSYKKLLLEGEYRLRWNGNGLYRDIDTTLFVPAGKMVYFNTPFERMTGKVRFVPKPKDALICFEGYPCLPGKHTVELPCGLYFAKIRKRGYESENRRFIVSADKITVIESQLIPNADWDGDGYADSIDQCPEVYGLYDGCPKQRFGDAVKIKMREVEEYIHSEPFSFTIAGIGMISRIPTRKSFYNFLSSFSGGRMGGVNNYKGLTLGNMYQVSYRGLLAQVELGQWSSGLRYRRPDTLVLNTHNDRYSVWYDSLFEVDPAIFFPSTALSFGFKYRLLNYSLSYSIGYQWEDIILDQIQRESDGKFHRIQFDNDWWFHEIALEADLFTDTKITPSAYVKIKFPFGSVKRTRWHVFHGGIQIRFRPFLKEEL
ncbi:MAG: PEGA domain-containing protein [Chitinispirillaceae bacterium]